MAVEGGVGPVAVAQHLSDFLPSHPLAPEISGTGSVGCVSGALGISRDTPNIVGVYRNDGI